MPGKHLAQLGAIVFAGLAITAALMDHSAKGPIPSEAGSARLVTEAAPDPLGAEFQRCQMLGEAAARDATCLAAWAANRRRFLRPEYAIPSPLPVSEASQVPVIPKAH